MPKPVSPYNLTDRFSETGRTKRFLKGGGYEEAGHAWAGSGHRRYRSNRDGSTRVGGLLVEWLELGMRSRLGGVASPLGMGMASSSLGLASRGMGLASGLGLAPRLAPLVNARVLPGEG